VNAEGVPVDGPFLALCLCCGVLCAILALVAWLALDIAAQRDVAIRERDEALERLDRCRLEAETMRGLAEGLVRIVNEHKA